MTCPQTSIIQDHVKEGKSLELDCAVIKDVKDLSNVASSKIQVLFTELKVRPSRAIFSDTFGGAVFRKQ